MHYQKGGGKYPIHVSRGSFASREEKLGEIHPFASRGEKLGAMHLLRGSLHSCIWELLFS
jgi:hypothetical protein